MKKDEKIIYPLSNPIVFAMVMNDKERCRKLLERILTERTIKDIKFAKDEYLETEKTIHNGVHYKSVRLDVLFEDEEAWYDIEMQVEDGKNLPNRSRYYHASVDTHSLLKGADYDDLKPCYVIFICMFDMMGQDEAVYRFQMREDNLGLPLGENRYTIILNTKCSEEKVPIELKGLFNYLEKQNTDDSKDEFINEMHSEVMKHNKGKELIALMTLEEELKIRYKRGREDGFAEGKLEAALENAKKMKERGMDTGLISEITGLSVEDVEKL